MNDLEAPPTKFLDRSVSEDITRSPPAGKSNVGKDGPASPLFDFAFLTFGLLSPSRRPSRFEESTRVLLFSAESSKRCIFRYA
jgi:hypothetical protein